MLEPIQKQPYATMQAQWQSASTVILPTYQSPHYVPMLVGSIISGPTMTQLLHQLSMEISNKSVQDACSPQATVEDLGHVQLSVVIQTDIVHLASPMTLVTNVAPKQWTFFLFGFVIASKKIRLLYIGNQVL
jgi:hypothetical protein